MNHLYIGASLKNTHVRDKIDQSKENVEKWIYKFGKILQSDQVHIFSRLLRVFRKKLPFSLSSIRMVCFQELQNINFNTFTTQGRD